LLRCWNAARGYIVENMPEYLSLHDIKIEIDTMVARLEAPEAARVQVCD
jgi:hypothetical protein